MRDSQSVAEFIRNARRTQINIHNGLWKLKRPDGDEEEARECLTLDVTRIDTQRDPDRVYLLGHLQDGDGWRPCNVILTGVTGWRLLATFRHFVRVYADKHDIPANADALSCQLKLRKGTAQWKGKDLDITEVHVTAFDPSVA